MIVNKLLFMIAIENDCEGFQFSRARSSERGSMAMGPLFIFLEEQKQKGSNKRAQRVLIRSIQLTLMSVHMSVSVGDFRSRLYERERSQRSCSREHERCYYFQYVLC